MYIWWCTLIFIWTSWWVKLLCRFDLWDKVLTTRLSITALPVSDAVWCAPSVYRDRAKHRTVSSLLQLREEITRKNINLLGCDRFKKSNKKNLPKYLYYIEDERVLAILVSIFSWKGFNRKGGIWKVTKLKATIEKQLRNSFQKYWFLKLNPSTLSARMANLFSASFGKNFTFFWSY